MRLIGWLLFGLAIGFAPFNIVAAIVCASAGIIYLGAGIAIEHAYLKHIRHTPKAHHVRPL